MKMKMKHSLASSWPSKADDSCAIGTEPLNSSPS